MVASIIMWIIILAGILAFLSIAGQYFPFDISIKAFSNDNLQTTKSNQSIDKTLDVPPRYMWGWDSTGYCGEMSFQSHGIYWGNWVSEENVRNSEGGNEILIGVNDITAAKKLKFTYDEWDFNNKKQPQWKGYIQWVRSHIDKGNIVVGGLYLRYDKKTHSDPDYDHIVPIIGYRTDSNDTVIGLFYNDLYVTNGPRLLNIPEDIHSRKECLQTAVAQQPYGYCLPRAVTYGIALTGIQDLKKETFRTTLILASNSEPDWGKEDNRHQQPVSMKISAKIEGLTVGKKYSLLRFDSIEALPSSDFLAGPWSNKFDITANAVNMIIENFDTIISDSSTFYRCVEVV